MSAMLLKATEFKTKTQKKRHHMRALINEPACELTRHSLYFPRLSDRTLCAEGQRHDLKMTDCISHGQNGHAVGLVINLIFLRRKMAY